MNLSNYNHIHFIGIGGISVSAAARLAKHLKKKVSGSDVAASGITKKLAREGIGVVIGHAARNIGEAVDLVVYSEAVQKDNPERVCARERGLAEMSVFEFWGAYAKDKKVIAVSGTNGKSTTTAMLGHILVEAGFDPTVVVGTKVIGWGSRPKAGQPLADNIRIGKSEWFVIEADEYAGHMHAFKPHIAVVTNIAADHLDFYKDVQDIQNHFERWLASVRPEGGMVLNAADAVSKKLSLSHARVRRFGIVAEPGIIRAAGITQVVGHNGWDGTAQFNIVDDELDWGWVQLKLPGKHNIENAVAAAVAADMAGVPKKKIIKALSGFSGTWRRFERVGFCRGAMVISDYAHHPDGIRATLAATAEWYPFKRVVLLYQPHQHNRTKNLFSDFVTSFNEAHELIVSEIYDVAGREEADDHVVSSKDLVEAIQKKSPSAHVHYAPDLKTAEQMVRKTLREGDVLIVMGAGDVDVVARNLAEK